MIKRLIYTFVVSISICFSTANNAASVYIDEFTITKNGSILFNDAFDDGTAPPSTGGNTQSYRVFGGPLGAESGGKLMLDASTGDSASRPDAANMSRQGARVLTNKDPATPNRGLRLDDTFSVTGLFDLTLLENVRERYGVRLSDGGSNIANDALGLSVMRTSSSQIDVVLHHFGQSIFTFVDLESIALEENHDQISMSLSRLDTSTNEITASFFYVDAGVMSSTTTFSTTSAIFNGEDFTRAHFMYLAPAAVPVPAALPLFTAGLALFGFLSKRRKH